MSKKSVLFHFLKIPVLGTLFYAAVYFENAQQQRLVILFLVFAAYIVIGLVRGLLKRYETLHSLSFLIDILLIYILEHNSRLLINYFLHSFYIVTLLEIALTLKRRAGTALGIIAVAVSLIKYVFLIYYRPNLSSVSQMAFFMLVNILILVMASFAQFNKEEKEKKDILYSELLNAYKQLKQYINEVNRLTVIEERNRIARDIHDSLGHNMTALIMQLQMAEHMLEEDAKLAKDLVVSSAATARDSLAGIRDVVKTLRGEEESTSTTGSLNKLVDEFSAKTGMKVHLKFNGESRTKNMEAEAAIFHIIQEALTNSVRHGKAEEVNITINYTEEKIEFNIKDNGQVSDFSEGYGLKGIRERVEAFKGSVEFKASEGFEIKGILMLGVGGND